MLVLSTVVFPAMLIIFSTSCGGGSSSSSSNSMSQAQAQAVSQQVFTTLGQALASAFSSDAAAPSTERPTLAAAFSQLQPNNDSSGCSGGASGETCDFTVNFSGSCPGGGTIAVGGDIDGTLNNSGDGSISANLMIAPNSCSVSNLVINGDPDITVATQINFSDSALVFPVAATIGGGMSYGPNPSGTCQLNVTATVSSATSCSYSGTVCGQAVSGSC
jgi:hypothetical protein